MDKTLQLLGLARRAGRLAIGADAVAESIKHGRAAAILMTRDASPRHLRTVEANGYTGKVLTLSADMDAVYRSVGKRSCIFALEDGGFAAAAEKTLNEEDAHHASKI